MTEANTDDRRSFEELVAELEEVTELMATGEVGIEAATDLYERAQRLYVLATERLARVQERVERLSRGSTEAGAPGRPAPTS